MSPQEFIPIQIDLTFRETGHVMGDPIENATDAWVVIKKYFSNLGFDRVVDAFGVLVADVPVRLAQEMLRTALVHGQWQWVYSADGGTYRIRVEVA